MTKNNTISIKLTIEEIKSLLNGLALAETQMEDDDGKKEMKDLGMNVFNQLSKKDLDKLRG